MIHGFARQSGGQAHIVSQPGRGSTVSLYLPRTLRSETAAEVTPGGPAMTYVSHGASILVVDDELMVRTLVIEMLEGMGHIVIGASDAESGLRVVVSGAPLDLMITDVGLPGRMDGRQLAEAARAHRPELKVLFITGYTADAVLDRARLAAGMHVMTKPFTLDVLARRINDLLAYAAFDTATHDAVLVS